MGTRRTNASLRLRRRRLRKMLEALPGEQLREVLALMPAAQAREQIDRPDAPARQTARGSKAADDAENWIEKGGFASADDLASLIETPPASRPKEPDGGRAMSTLSGGLGAELDSQHHWNTHDAVIGSTIHRTKRGEWPALGGETGV
jgi:hypothetical protein